MHAQSRLLLNDGVAHHHAMSYGGLCESDNLDCGEGFNDVSQGLCAAGGEVFETTASARKRKAMHDPSLALTPKERRKKEHNARRRQKQRLPPAERKEVKRKSIQAHIESATSIQTSEDIRAFQRSETCLLGKYKTRVCVASNTKPFPEAKLLANEQVKKERAQSINDLMNLGFDFCEWNGRCVCSIQMSHAA